MYEDVIVKRSIVKANYVSLDSLSHSGWCGDIYGCYSLGCGVYGVVLGMWGCCRR